MNICVYVCVGMYVYVGMYIYVWMPLETSDLRGSLPELEPQISSLKATSQEQLSQN